MYMERITSAEIFISLFCRERFYSATHMPFFTQHFSPQFFKRSVYEDMSRALLRRASLDPKADLAEAVEPLSSDSTLFSKDIDRDDTFVNLFKPSPSLYSHENVKMLTQEAADRAVTNVKRDINNRRYSAADGDREQVEKFLSSDDLQNRRLFAQYRYAVRYNLEEDRARVITSAPFRRMQQKTQVFPLDINASSRSRLTHSNEVAALARYTLYALAGQIHNINPLLNEMVTCVETAAYLHDIGNPPFGHFGEQVIRDWITQEVQKHADKISAEESDDLRAFNGNAQGLRLAHTVYKLNLSLGQISSCIKVPYTCKELRESSISEEKIHANVGCYISEKEVLDMIRSSNLSSKRHPLSLIMEQCDDLAYVLADLEDAYDRHVLKDKEIYHLFDSLITFIKFNACSTTCDKCISACTCANGYKKLSYGLSSEMVASLKFAAPAKDDKKDSASNKDADEESGSANGSDSTAAHKEEVKTQKSKQDKKGNCGKKVRINRKGESACVYETVDYSDEKVSLDVVLEDMIKHAYTRMKNDSFGVLQLVHGNNPIPLTEMMEQLGVRALLALFKECISTYYILDIVNTIKENEREFFEEGRLNITYYGNDAHKAVEFIRLFEEKAIYTDNEVMSLEMQGAACIKGLFNAYSHLLGLSEDAFYKCLSADYGDMYSRHLMHRIPRRCKEGYLDAVKAGTSSEMYARIRMLIDYISGMTDTFAAHEFSILSGFRSPSSII